MFVYGMLEDEALPGSEVFALLLLALLATFGGWVVGKLTLPPLL
ncbi:hypothetical protein NPIL_504201, partial [Nephila pilipes]